MEAISKNNEEQPPLQKSSPNLWSIGEIQLIIIVVILSLIIYYFFYEEFLKLLYCCSHFNTLSQLIIPFIFGGIGGYSSVIMGSLSTNYSNHIHIKKKFSFIGAIAGIAAVNLLNPSGSISQVMILALLAGLSGFSYLKRSALVDSSHEETILNAAKSDQKSLSEPHEDVTPVTEKVQQASHTKHDIQKRLEELRRKANKNN